MEFWSIIWGRCNLKSRLVNTSSCPISHEKMVASTGGMTPPELLLASLGSCAAYYAAEYLHRHELATEGTRVRLVAEKIKNPARVDN